jgi:Skp family chaperone for outer membrane proteins
MDMSKLYSAISKLDNQIFGWEKIVKDHPDDAQYKKALSSLRKVRAETIQLIGKKNETEKSKCASHGKA